MSDLQNQLAQTHDLLQIDPGPFLLSTASIHLPGWAAQSLRRTPYLHVRRTSPADEAVPAGVRGAARAQRWPVDCPPAQVIRVFRPTDANRLPIDPARARQIPALGSLAILRDRWSAIGLPWGPIGSIGFELLTGRATATVASDLDIVLYAAERFSRTFALHLCALAEDLPTRIDIRAETGACGFSLREYATCQTLLLRTAAGPVLAADPWACQSAGVTTTHRAEHL